MQIEEQDNLGTINKFEIDESQVFTVRYFFAAKNLGSDSNG